MRMTELRPAYSWDCDDCGVENFTRAIVPELSEEKVAELKEEQGIESWEDGEFMMIPNIVICKDCKAEFSTMHFREEEHD